MGNDRDKEAEQEVFNRFSRIARDKLQFLADGSSDGREKMNQLESLYKQPEFNAEKKILNDMNNLGLSKGVLVGLGCFAFLRISPKMISNVLRRRAGVTTNPFTNVSSYKFDPPQQQPNLDKPGLFFRLLRLSVDTFVSLSMGAYASLYFVPIDKLRKGFSDIPLVEGRSLLSEELCDDFTKEFQKLDPQILTNMNDDASAPFRSTIKDFVTNCKRRAIYEEEIRKERGLSKEEPVVIPPPGVSKSISVSLDDLLEDGEFDNNKNYEDVTDFDTYFDMGGDDEQKTD